MKKYCFKLEDSFNLKLLGEKIPFEIYNYIYWSYLVMKNANETLNFHFERTSILHNVDEMMLFFWKERFTSCLPYVYVTIWTCLPNNTKERWDKDHMGTNPLKDCIKTHLKAILTPFWKQWNSQKRLPDFKSAIKVDFTKTRTVKFIFASRLL